MLLDMALWRMFWRGGAEDAWGVCYAGQVSMIEGMGMVEGAYARCQACDDDGR